MLQQSKAFFVILFLVPAFISASPCHFMVKMANQPITNYQIKIKQLTQPKTQNSPETYKLIDVTPSKDNQQWTFATLPLFSVIELDLIDKHSPSKLIGAWSIGYKQDCSIQSVGNKMNNINRNPSLGMRFDYDKTSQTNLLTLFPIAENNHH